MKLNYKDNTILLNAIINLATDLYNSNKSIILNNIIKNGSYTSNYGEFYIRTKKAKTVNDIIIEKQDKIKKLQKEIDLLRMQIPDSIYTDTTNILNCKTADITMQLAKEVLRPTIETIDNKRINNKYIKL